MSEIAKKNAAFQALNYLHSDCVLGIGTGSTVNYFIEALKDHRHKLSAVVSSSEQSTQKLRSLGIPVVELMEVGSQLDLYIDGADEINPQKEMIKGGGGALTREKILAECARQFICIVSPEKCVEVLGKFPLPLEILPLARGLVARKIIALGGTPKLRENFKTDQGNFILDVIGLDLSRPIEMELKLSQIPGVFAAGVFALRPADQILMGHP